MIVWFIAFLFCYKEQNVRSRYQLSCYWTLTRHSCMHCTLHFFWVKLRIQLIANCAKCFYNWTKNDLFVSVKVYSVGSRCFNIQFCSKKKNSKIWSENIVWYLKWILKNDFQSYVVVCTLTKLIEIHGCCWDMAEVHLNELPWIVKVPKVQQSILYDNIEHDILPC